MPSNSYKITLKEFLKKYTAINENFINEYYKFYELCEQNKFGIELTSVAKYLDIKKKEEFYKSFRDKFKQNIDYIKKEFDIHKRKKKGDIYVRYYMTLDTFEKICLTSKAEKANSVRDYFIILRRFIQYYKDNISKMIISTAKKNPKSCVYIILVNKNKNIFKIGRTDDLRNRLRNMENGHDKHPDVKFIMLVKNNNFVENCVKDLIEEKRYKSGKEIYKVDINKLKNVMVECSELDSRINNYSNQSADAYIIFEDKDFFKSAKTNSKNKSKTKTRSKTKSKSKTKINKSNRTLK